MKSKKILTILALACLSATMVMGCAKEEQPNTNSAYQNGIDDKFSEDEENNETTDPTSKPDSGNDTLGEYGDASGGEYGGEIDKDTESEINNKSDQYSDTGQMMEVDQSVQSLVSSNVNDYENETFKLNLKNLLLFDLQGVYTADKSMTTEEAIKHYGLNSNDVVEIFAQYNEKAKNEEFVQILCDDETSCNNVINALKQYKENSTASFKDDILITKKIESNTNQYIVSLCSFSLALDPLTEEEIDAKFINDGYEIIEKNPSGVYIIKKTELDGTEKFYNYDITKYQKTSYKDDLIRSFEYNGMIIVE